FGCWGGLPISCPALGCNQCAHEGEGAYDRSSAVKGIPLEREAGERDRARHLTTILREANRVVQSRDIRVGGKVKVNRSCDYAALAGWLPWAKLTGEEECRPPLSRIDHGHGGVGMQRTHPARNKISRRVLNGGDVGPALKPLISAVLSVQR